MQPDPDIRYLKSFILYILIATVGGILIGMIQGAMLGGILGVAGVDLGSIRVTCGITGFFFGTAVLYLQMDHPDADRSADRQAL